MEIEEPFSEQSVTLYALSTCIWCRRTRKLLDELSAEYDLIEVDLTSGDERKRVIEELRKHNPRCSFPTIVIDQDRDCIIGFQERKIRERFSNRR